MKKFISLLGLLLIASAVFAQSFTLKTADKTPCTITLNGDFIVIEETLLGGYINRITIPKSQFTSTKAKIDSEQGGKSVINNKPFMESGDGRSEKFRNSWIPFWKSCLSTESSYWYLALQKRYSCNS